jgi:hypothetical protein
MALHRRRIVMPVATSLLLALAAGGAGAQARPFVFSLVPVRESGAPRATLYGDMAYGEHLFAALGPEHFEQRLGADVALNRRMTLVVQGGWTTQGRLDASRGTVQAEVFSSLLPSTSRGLLSVSVGARRDYEATGVIIGRAVAGYRWSGTTLASNLRVEHGLRRSGGAAGARDALDVSTSAGVSHVVTSGLRLGVEGVAEDLEGLVDPAEAEGGARLMLGPSVRVGPRGSRWGVLVAGGPVVRLSRSTVTSLPVTGGRDLALSAGFVIRTSVSYAW